MGMTNNTGTSGPRRQGKVTVYEEWAIRWSNGAMSPSYERRGQAERRLVCKAGRSAHGGAANPTVVCRTVTVTDWAGSSCFCRSGAVGEA